MKVEWDAILDVLVDPVGRTRLRLCEDEGELVSPTSRYQFVNGQPVLLVDEGFESGGWRFPAVALTETHRPRPAGGPEPCDGNRQNRTSASRTGGPSIAIAATATGTWAA